MKIDILKINHGSYTTSAEAAGQSKELLKRLGFHHNYQIARLAISRSMAEPDFPKAPPDSRGGVIKGHQLFGDERNFHLLWISLVVENWNKFKPNKEITFEDFQDVVRYHWHRGAALLSHDWVESEQNFTKFVDILVSRRATLSEISDDGNPINIDETIKEPDPPQDKTLELQKVLKQLQISAEVKGVKHGPRLSKYKIHLTDINHLSKLEGKTDEIEVALGVSSVIANSSNEPNIVYLDISRESNTWIPVSGANIRNWVKNYGDKLTIPICLGVDAENNPYCFDLATAPHLMVAGTTNSGKSIALHAAILSLLYKFGISGVKFLLIDPKRVELTSYGVLPNLEEGKIITEASEATQALENILDQIDDRNKMFESNNVQNIASYHSLGKKLPYIVVVIEELADLIMQVKISEDKIVRIAQVGRSAGVHLILSTQRPDAKTFSGLLRSNTARVALSVQKATDSRIILDEQGAEKLLGRGDMLIKPQAGAISVRAHGAFVRKTDIKECLAAVIKTP